MRFGIVATLLAVVGLALPAFASADPLGEATFYKSGLRSAAIVRNVTPGPDGNVWFIDERAASGIPAIGRITPEGTITEYCSTGCAKTLTGLNAESDLVSIVAGPGESKYLWFTDSGTTPAIGVIDSASGETATVKEFSTGLNAESKPVDIAVGPEGNLWFTDEGATNAIGMAVLNAEKNEIVEIKEFSTGLNAGSRPQGIVAGPDGNLWFTDTGTTPAVGMIDPGSQAIEEFSTGATSLPGGEFPEMGPFGIVAGTDGNVWFVESGNNEVNGKAICRILTSGEVGKFSCFKEGLIASSNPTALTVTPGGKLWFTDSSGVEEKQVLEISDTSEETLGGTYKLSFEGKETGGTGSGNLLSSAKGKGDVKRFTAAANVCPRVAGSSELKCTLEPTAAEVGMRIEGGASIPTETTIVSVNKAGKTITMSKPAASSSTTAVTAGRVINVGEITGTFEVGQPLTGTGISTNTVVLSVGEEGGKVTLVPSKAPTAAGTGVSVEGNASKTTVTNITNPSTFSKGETISGEGISAGTTITAVNTTQKTLTLSAAPTEAKTGTSLSSALAYNASEATVEEALQKLSTIGAQGVGVTKTGTFPVKREITFLGTRKDADVEQVVCNGAGLTGTSPSCTVTTIVQGVPNAIGCMTIAGKACGRYSFPELFGGPGGIAYMSGDNVWLSSGATSSSTLGKVGVEEKPTGPTNRRTITLTKSPAGNAGAGLGTVSSKPKGIKCAQTCDEAVGRFFKEQAVVLTAAPSGELSAFDKWVNCPSPVGLVCTVPADKADYEIEAVFKGSSKAFSPAEALTLSKGDSEENRGWGTVKATGLTCEAECQETTVLYLGPTGVEPKIKPGKVVELKALPAFGSEFVGWSGGGCSGTELTCKVPMEEDEEVVAEFADLPDFALTLEKKYEGGLGTVTSKAKGISCGTTCTATSADMPEDAAVLLTAKPAKTEPATTFVKWLNPGGDCHESTSTTCTVTMDEAITIKAVFSGPVKAIVNQKSLTLAKEGNGYGTVKAAGLTCEVLCSTATSLYYGPVEVPKPKAGAKVTLKATSAPGSTQVAWTGCKENPTPNECIVVIGEEDAEVSAKFDELE
jgi:streptogramin lyase